VDPHRVAEQGALMAGQLSLDPFRPGAATGGAHGIFLAVLFGLLAISGFDVVTPVAEETRTLRRLVPLATILVTVIPGVFWMLACSRMLYALAREGFAPCWLAEVHPRSRIPWNAQLLVLGLVAVVPVGLGVWQGSYLAAFGWGSCWCSWSCCPTSPSTWPTSSITCAGAATGSTGS
jgi:amino acid transporter